MEMYSHGAYRQTFITRTHTYFPPSISLILMHTNTHYTTSHNCLHSHRILSTILKSYYKVIPVKTTGSLCHSKKKKRIEKLLRKALKKSVRQCLFSCFLLSHSCQVWWRCWMLLWDLLCRKQGVKGSHSCHSAQACMFFFLFLHNENINMSMHLRGSIFFQCIPLAETIWLHPEISSRSSQYFQMRAHQFDLWPEILI